MISDFLIHNLSLEDIQKDISLAISKFISDNDMRSINESTSLPDAVDAFLKILFTRNYDDLTSVCLLLTEDYNFIADRIYDEYVYRTMKMRKKG